MLRTPTEELWPGVTELPDFKGNFPNWTDLLLGESMPTLDEASLDALEVNIIPHRSS